MESEMETREIKLPKKPHRKSRGNQGGNAMSEENNSGSSPMNKAADLLTIKGMPSVVWLVPALILLIACVPTEWASWYYETLRWVSSFCFLAIIAAEWRVKTAERTPWILLYIFLLVIFNPFYVMSFEVQLHWIMMDVLGIVILLVHWLEVRREKKAEMA